MSEPARIPHPPTTVVEGWARVDRVAYTVGVWTFLVLGFLLAVMLAVNLDWM